MKRRLDENLNARVVLAGSYRMVNVRSAFLGALLAGIGLTGCERRPSAPPTPGKNAAPASTQPAKPTTQALMSGRSKVLLLPGMPLMMRVPESWSIDTTGPLVVIGPSPFEQVTIGLSHTDSTTFKPERIDLLYERAQKELQSHPAAVNKADLRSVGGMKLLEKRFNNRPMTIARQDIAGNGVTDEKGNLITTTVQPIEWTLTAFVSNGEAYNRFELSVLDLTAEQYAVDQPLIEKVLNSVALAGGASSTTQPQASIPPAGSGLSTSAPAPGGSSQ